ncbi:hypothetical protein RhiJN_17494 [Ceratobasidium sp. AG-Ba]|nr:hypothetical protein RhiJN_17494 [Ceratobasidium sp. AG-Ba]
MTEVEGSIHYSPIAVDECTTISAHSSHIDTIVEYTSDNTPQTPSSTMPRSAHTSMGSRTARPRISTNRARPYHDGPSRSSVRKSATPCKYFQLGNCSAGSVCRYQHVIVSPTHATDELDRQLLAFVSDDTSVPPNVDEMQLSPEETKTCVAEVRYHSTVDPNQSRTYFIAQRQAVVGYEGNNVGVLSGGVLLGIPGAVQQPGTLVKIPEDASESEATGSSSPSSSSHDSDTGIWKGPVWFDDGAATEHLDWADDEFVHTPMEGVESSFSSGMLSELPARPPVIRRIIRSAEHNRRHSLS